MNWKSWPYWMKGGIIGICIVILAIVIISTLAATSSFCGLNTAGPDPSHVCNGSERIALFSEVLPIFLIWWPLRIGLIGTVLLSMFIGYLYGKFKNRKKVV